MYAVPLISFGVCVSVADKPRVLHSLKYDVLHGNTLYNCLQMNSLITTVYIQLWPTLYTMVIIRFKSEF